MTRTDRIFTRLNSPWLTLLLLVGFVWLGNYSYHYVRRPAENHGYSKSEIRQHDSLLARSVKAVANAEAHRDDLASLFNTRPIGKEVNLYFKGKIAP